MNRTKLRLTSLLFLFLAIMACEKDDTQEIVEQHRVTFIAKSNQMPVEGAKVIFNQGDTLRTNQDGCADTILSVGKYMYHLEWGDFCSSIESVTIIDCDIEEEITIPYEEYVMPLRGFAIDNSHSIILYNDTADLKFEKKFSLLGHTHTLNTTDTELAIGKAYTFDFSNRSYRLYRTKLPIITIDTKNKEIPDEPKISGKIKVIENGVTTFESHMGIERRGGVSQRYPKKSYSVELWTDSEGSDDVKESLLGMRSDDDWILDGLWNEPNRIRDFTCHDIWLKIARNCGSDETVMGINRRFCEVFLNGKYVGIYYLGEKVDKKQLDLKKYKKKMEGELYKGSRWADGVLFKSAPSYNNSKDTWSGYEAKLPDEIGEIDWSNLHQFVQFVVESSQTDFNNQIGDMLEIKNAIDYYIFMNLSYAWDNRGKNLYTAKNDSEGKYYFIAWDMDGTFGDDWRGERTDITDQMLSNGLFDKLLKWSNFREQLKQRWSELRSETISNQNLYDLFKTNSDILETSNCYEREALVPKITQHYSTGELSFIKSWINRRCSFLDNYFDNL